MKKVLIGIAALVMYSCTDVNLPAEMNQFDELIYTPSKSVFRVNSPTDAQGVAVRIYDDATAEEPSEIIGMQLGEDSVWSNVVKGNLIGKFYTFQLTEADGTVRAETPGVFAKAVGVNGKRGAIIDLASTDPEEWNTDVRPKVELSTDLVIYEMHHRDFSSHPESGFNNKGKFLALTEPKAAEYLNQLGVNAVHILPSFDYASVDETRLDEAQYNWGYDPVNYNVPDGSYSTDPYDPTARIREFKQMVQALHKAGIRVILDVVYNHTFDIDGSNFQLTYPDYYYRKNADGTYSDGSGCGNETASEKPLMREFIIESVKYWVNEYHIDGFRFDLMGIHDIETMNRVRDTIDEIDPTIFIYGEGWSAGSCAYPQEKLAMKANTKELNRIGAFCDDMRDALRGPFSNDSEGAFLAGLPGHAESIKFGIVGAIDHPQVDIEKVNYSKASWVNDPVQMIAYVSCHDDMCLVDRLRASIPGITDDELIRLDLLAQTAVLTSQGVPFILSGEEMLRDKKGVHNSYNSPDSINVLDWSHLEKYPQVFDYYSKLIHLRLNHPAFRMGTSAKVARNLTFLDTDNESVVAYHVNGVMSGDSWSDIIVILNASKQPQKVAIRKGTFTIVCKDGVIDENGMGEVTDSIAVAPAQSALILKR